MKIFLFVLTVFTFFSCKSEKKQPVATFHDLIGETMGTHYKISYDGPAKSVIQPQIERLLMEINNEVSTYVPNSIISQFNRDTLNSIFCFNPTPSNHFFNNLLESRIIFAKSDHYFDPTVMPAINYWGFGYKGRKKRKSEDSFLEKIKERVGLEKIEIVQYKDSTCIEKLEEKLQLDFSAIAKGYAVDKVGELLKLNQINNFVIDIGGENLASGLNKKKQNWKLGINTPLPGTAYTDIFQVVSISDKALATSGNYRNFYTENDQLIAHIVNPKTCKTEKTNILSVSVFANQCMIADAYATALMSMPLDKALSLAKNIKKIDALIIYMDEKGHLSTKYTSGVEKYLVKK